MMRAPEIRKFAARKADGREGSALILALLVVVVLSMLVGSFGFEARLEAKYASYARNRVKASQLAESGIVIAEMLMARQAGGGGAGQPDEEDRWFDASERLRLGQSITGLVEPVGEGYVILDIVPDSLHQRVPVFLGSCNEVAEATRYHREHDEARNK